MTLKISPQELNQILTEVDETSFAEMNQFVMFLGHAHSGHSIIGAIIDSHPEAAIANEINLPKLMVDFDLSLTDIKKITLHSALSQFEKNWTNTGYRYNIPESAQGQVKKLLVLGDKKGGGSTRVIRNNPWVYKKLLEMFNQRFKVIHVSRNLYDNIAAFAHYWQEPLGEKHVIRYFENLETILACQNITNPSQWLSLDHDKFIHDLDPSLDQIFGFLNLELTTRHRKNIHSIVNKSSHSRRETVEWPSQIIDLINGFKAKLKIN